jgi:hypothetical protein
VLVVGLIPDSEILRCKGPPVLNERERYLLVDAVKWVDEVVKGDRGGVGIWGGTRVLGCFKQGLIAATAGRKLAARVRKLAGEWN